MILGIYGGIGNGKTTFAELIEKQAPAYLHFESSDLIIDVANSWRGTIDVAPQSDNINEINAWLNKLPQILEEVVHVEADQDQLLLTPEKIESRAAEYGKLLMYLEYVNTNPEKQKSVINSQTKAEFRPILQWLGGFLYEHVDEGIWLNEIVRRVQARPDVPLITVSGLRFKEDAQRVKDIGGYIVQINRPSASVVDSQDFTEQGISMIESDFRVINDGSLDQLEHCAEQIYKDLDKLQPELEYKASNF